MDSDIGSNRCTGKFFSEAVIGRLLISFFRVGICLSWGSFIPIVYSQTIKAVRSICCLLRLPICLFRPLDLVLGGLFWVWTLMLSETLKDLSDRPQLVDRKGGRLLPCRWTYHPILGNWSSGSCLILSARNFKFFWQMAKRSSQTSLDGNVSIRMLLAVSSLHWVCEGSKLAASVEERHRFH